MQSDSHLYPPEQYQGRIVYCPNDNCAGLSIVGTRIRAGVEVVRDLGQTYLVGDMPKCHVCATEMVWEEDLKPAI